MSSLRYKYEQEHLIQRERLDNIHIDKMSAMRDSDDEQMDDFSELPTEKKTMKRQRLYSGCIQKSNSQTSEGTNESLDSLILKRESSSNIHSKGYLGLALLFGVMCASSLTNNQASEAAQFKEPLPR